MKKILDGIFFVVGGYTMLIVLGTLSLLELVKNQIESDK